jgi:hypothetical protein
MPTNNYNGVIWTNHALDRLDERLFPQKMAYDALRFPDHYEYDKDRQTTKYTRRFGDQKVTVIAKKNENKEWIVLSCWIDPPVSGSVDDKKKKYYQEYNKAGFWGKFFLGFRRQILGW